MLLSRTAEECRFVRAEVDLTTTPQISINLDSLREVQSQVRGSLPLPVSFASLRGDRDQWLASKHLVIITRVRLGHILLTIPDV